jgi:parallel beta-helix repeat protein
MSREKDHEDSMKKFALRLCVLALPLVLAVNVALAAVPPGQANFDAAQIKPFTTQMLKYESTEKTGDFPGPWVPGAWADGATGRIETVADGGDGTAAVRMTNVSGQPSLMFKTWTPVSLVRGSWEARVEYRKGGKSSGRLEISGLDNKKIGIDLSPTGDAFKPAVLQLDIGGNGADIQPTFQLYGGTGAEEALYIRSFNLVRVGDVSAAIKAKEEQANALRNAEAEAAAKREAQRRAAERKPIGKWVRPETKPVKMTKPLEPPPVTGKTYFVATSGNNQSADGSQGKPWGTIQHGMNQLHPGDRLYIRGGEYKESMLTLTRSGKPSGYITVAGYPGEKVKVINNGGLAVFNLDAGSPWTPVRLREEAYIVFRDLYVDMVNGNQAFRINGPMMLPEYSNNVVKSRGLRHNIWIVGCEIVGGGPAEGGLGGGYGAHDLVFSNNRVHSATSGMMSYVWCDGTILEWNTIYDTSIDQDDGGALKSMAPAVIIRYNTVYNNNRRSTSKKAGWAPESEGGAQWRFLQGVSGIYLDFAMLHSGNNNYPEPLRPKDPANYVYGNTVYNNNAGIYVFMSDGAQVYDNVVYGNGRTTTGGWLKGEPDTKWLEFVGPAGYGIPVSASKNVKVFNNISHSNQKAGVAPDDAKGFQAVGNVLFNNDLAQIDIRNGNSNAFGFNKVIATVKQGPPIRRTGENFPSFAAFREKFPYQDEGSEVVPLPAGTQPVTLAEKLRKEKSVSAAVWQTAYQRLSDQARAAGVDVPPATVPQAAYDPTGSLQAPLPWRLPGNVEFENYDVGGPNVSFSDTSDANEGGHYRKDAVDIKANKAAGNGAVVGFTYNGEWMEYTVSVATAGNYLLSAAYATPERGRRISLSLNGKPLGQAITFAPTASWEALKTVDSGTVALPEGDSVLRVTVESGPVDLDRLEFRPTP